MRTSRAAAMELVVMEEELQRLRSRATELLLREDWKEYINLYTHFISLCLRRDRRLLLSDAEGAAKLRKSLCHALLQRAEARSRLRDLSGALQDCDAALDVDPVHGKALVCKGKVLLELDLYARASECFQCALSGPTCGSADAVRELLGRSRRLEAQSRTGALDLSDWFLNGFNGASPELAEFVGPVEIRRSVHGGRGLFVTRSVDAGTPLVIAKAVVMGGGILPEGSSDGDRMAMWKDFVNKILDAAEKCSRTLHLIYQLSTGNEDDGLEVPDTKLFKPQAAEESFPVEDKEPDVERILRILDVNCITEDPCRAQELGRSSSYSGVGLWILPSFVNHSCAPTARRLHIGDRVVVYASRDVKADEELTFAYFDVLSPFAVRAEMAKKWGFECRCARCVFEGTASFGHELREFERDARSGTGVEEVAARLEDAMRRWAVKTEEKGFLRASFWPCYVGVYESERLTRRWGRRIPAASAAVASVAEAVGGNERVLKVLLGKLKKGGTGSRDAMEMEKAMRLGRGTYGKVMKRAAMRALFELAI